VSLAFVVEGVPAPQGSKTMMKHNRSGKMIMLESSKAVGPWRKKVTAAAVLALPLDWVMLSGPVQVRVVFAFERPKSHYRTGKFSAVLRDDAPPYPVAGGNDTDKLARAILDALTDALVWKDDAQVVGLHAVKGYAGEGFFTMVTKPGAWISVKPVTDGEAA
jgi:crossover junction endodeoxyribonuclease RusA